MDTDNVYRSNRRAYPRRSSRWCQIGTLNALVTRGGLAIALLAATQGDAADHSARSPKRAKPPQWSQDVRDLFFSDAREILQGLRPRYSTLDNTSADGADRDTDTRATEQSAAASKQNGWSALIDAEIIETEIKRLAQLVSRDVTAPGPFKGGGYRACRRHFSTLAVLFAVAAEYDQPVRWKDVAGGLRDVFARAGHNCKAGTDQTFREADVRKQNLTELIRGGRPAVPAAEPEADWNHVADRAPLMQRMEQAHEERLSKWLANRDQFHRNRDDARHEAQLVAMLARVIQQEGFEYWDDPTYAEHAQQLQDAASRLAEAAGDGDVAAARDALGKATKACSNCHEGYRG